METSLYQIPEPLEELAKAGKDGFLLGSAVFAEAGHWRKDCGYISAGLSDSAIPERSLDELVGRLALEILFLNNAVEFHLTLPAHIFLPLNIHL